MSESKRVLICEYHQETNTFNPIPFTVEAFRGQRYRGACTADQRKRASLAVGTGAFLFCK